jgi:glycerol-3-phosphate dehydrogenase
MKRDDLIARLAGRSERWDIIVIGGGATGLGTAVDAASRGFRTLLLEQSDFAKATSSRSTKLIHGGLRYLRQGNVSLVRESLHERGLLLRNAPHVVHPLPFIVPNYKWWEPAFYGVGLKIYDLLAGELGIARSHLLSRDETLRRVPTIESDGLRGGVLYHDAQFDDTRLAIALARTLDDLGGVPVNYARVVSLLKDDARVCGVAAVDLESGAEHQLKARAVINATGVFTDAIRRMDDAGADEMLTPSQGTHIVLEKSFLPGDTAIIVPKTDDGRVLFAIPWHDHVLIGTTDTPMRDVPIEPRPLESEIDYLLEHAARYLAKKPRREDIRSAFAGLRPLVKTGAGGPTSKVPRDHTIEVSQSGLITITGGKWTTYRKMAQDAVDRAIEVADIERRTSQTATLRLHGWMENSASIFGSDTPRIEELAASDPRLAEPLHPRLPYRACDAVWAAREEMARTVEDMLARRTRALFLDARASIEAAPRVADLLAAELGRDARWQAEQVAAYRELARSYLP